MGWTSADAAGAGSGPAAAWEQLAGLQSVACEGRRSAVFGICAKRHSGVVREQTLLPPPGSCLTPLACYLNRCRPAHMARPDYHRRCAGQGQNRPCNQVAKPFCQCELAAATQASRSLSAPCHALLARWWLSGRDISLCLWPQHEDMLCLLCWSVCCLQVHLRLPAYGIPVSRHPPD